MPRTYVKGLVKQRAGDKAGMACEAPGCTNIESSSSPSAYAERQPVVAVMPAGRADARPTPARAPAPLAPG